MTRRLHWAPRRLSSRIVALFLGLLLAVPAIGRLLHFARPTGAELGVAIGAAVLAFVATLYPSWRASRVNPAEALRYE